MQIFFANGTAVYNLNELEYANSLLYANIYQTSFIVAIDIDKGKIAKFNSTYDFINLN